MENNIKLLHNRHNLSFRQIDLHFGTDNSSSYLNESVNALKIVKELLLIIDELQNNNIEFVVLKGPVLSQKIYKDESYRNYHDIDLLIDYHNIEKVIDCLKSKNYHTEKAFSRKQNDKKKYFIHNKDIKFINLDKKILLEIHWRLNTYDTFNKNDTKSFLENYTTDYMFHGRQIKVLKNEFELLYITLHGAMHKWAQLRWLYEINDYMSMVEYDKAVFYQLSNDFNYNRLLSLYNILAKKYIKKAKTFEIQKKVPPYLINECINAIDNSIFIDEDFAETVHRSFHKLKFLYLLMPKTKIRLFLFKKYIIRDLNYKKILNLVKTKVFRTR